MYVKTTSKSLISVGVDVGSSTSHVVFSRLLLEKDPHSRTEKFEIKKREIIHSGPIHLTPFIDPQNIDFKHLRELILADYQNAGFEISEIDTGAVIVTGETAKKENADEIVRLLADETGKFVAATAGPNFESVLAAFGSGAVAESEETGLTIMNVDVGGGSSNIAVCKNGRVVETAATNVGGRLVAIDENGCIIRLENTGYKIALELGFELSLGDRLSEQIIQSLSKALADALLEAITGTPSSIIGKMLMMTPPLELGYEIDRLTFSGGVAEYIYGKENKSYGDLGQHLANEIIAVVERENLPLSEPHHRIRATVIGAGQSSLHVSGSTTFLSAGLEYPLRNLPVIVPTLPLGKLTIEEVADAIEDAFKRFDIIEGEDRILLAFRDAVRPSYENLTIFAKGVIRGLPNTVKSGKPIMMCFTGDIGNSVGNVMRRETGIINEVLSIDEIDLAEGDFVDIGEPIIENVVVPVVIKTLVFDKNSS